MAQVQDQEGGSVPACIYSEEDLQRAIELGAWYDSEEDETCSDDEDTDSGADQYGYLNQVLNWKLFWSTEQQEDKDDPAFVKTELSLPRAHTVIVEELLNQILSEAEDIDGGGRKYARLQTSNGVAEADLKRSGVGLGTSPYLAGIGELGTSVDPDDKPKYYYIAYEIMTSERTYVQNLRLFEKVVHGAVRTAQLTGRNILPEEARKDIFLNIGEIYALTFDLLQELEERLKHWEPNAVFADAIAVRAPFFKLYSMYSERFENAQVAYSKWLKSSKQFAQLIKTIESGSLCKGLPVSSYMLCPIQRIPRYKLLLEDYLKHLPKGHPDLVNAEAALAAISEAASHMNARICDLESQTLVMKVQQNFTGKDSLVAPGRKYIGRGPVDFFSTGRRKQRILFLFSDILLVAAFAAQGKYRIRHKLQLKNILVNTLDHSSALKNGFCIAEKGTNKPFRFCTKSQEERNRWIRKLNRAKTNNNDHFTINRKSKYATVLNDPEAHNSIQAVLNDPSFEHGQPSWVRRSNSRIYRSSTLPLRLALAAGSASATPTSSSLPRPLAHEEVDLPTMADDERARHEEILTEFLDENEDEREKVLSTKSLKPGMDNSLSSYVNQRSAKGDEWKRWWFVLTNYALVCYDNHLNDEATRALPLAGYKLSIPTAVDDMKRSNVFKLAHPRGRSYFFQLPSSYDFERWCSVMNELLNSTANS